MLGLNSAAKNKKREMVYEPVSLLLVLILELRGWPTFALSLVGCTCLCILWVSGFQLMLFSFMLFSLQRYSLSQYVFRDRIILIQVNCCCILHCSLPLFGIVPCMAYRLQQVWLPYHSFKFLVVSCLQCFPEYLIICVYVFILTKNA